MPQPSDTHRLAAALALAVRARDEFPVSDPLAAVVERMIAESATLDPGGPVPPPTDEDLRLVSLAADAPARAAGLTAPLAEPEVEMAAGAEVGVAWVAWAGNLARWAWPIAVGAVRRYGPRAASMAREGFRAAWRNIGRSRPVTLALRWLAAAGGVLLGARWAGEAIATLGRGVGEGARAAGGGLFWIAAALWLLTQED